MPYKSKEARAAYYQANKEKIRSANKAWAAANREKMAGYVTAWVKNNPERRKAILDTSAIRCAETKKASEAARRAQDRELFNARCRSSAAKNPARVREAVSKRRAQKLRATPGWFGELDALVVAEAHRLAVLREAATGFKWHVDHEIPLRGVRVSGLHVWNNLRVIPAKDNIVKRNHFSPQGA